jgi:hypothetical protein
MYVRIEYTQNKIIENIYFKCFKTGSKVIGIQQYCDNTLLLFALCKLLYLGIAKLPFLMLLLLVHRSRFAS